jgi:outer membrane protein OmpA-like peptidoglycan-associated protein
LLVAGAVDVVVLDAMVWPRFLASKARPALALPAPTVAAPPAPVVSPPLPVSLAPETPAPVQAVVAPPEALPSLRFWRNAAVLTKDARATLGKLAAILTEQPELLVYLNGHTDDLGPPRVNTPLSLRRARVAQAWLMDRGIARTRVTVQGFGASAPLEGVITPATRPQNRRVEIEFR